LISDAPDVDTYLSELSEERREALSVLRDLIHRVAPDASESMKYGLPHYDLQGPYFALASQKHYMSLYISETDLIAASQAELSHLNTGKSCIRFRKLDQLPMDVVEEILRAAAERRRPEQGDPSQVET
jgi:uncharacterized protein YdhG (YjbR/CyaY superfamily)